MILLLTTFLFLHIFYLYLKRISLESSHIISFTEIIGFTLLNISILSWLYAEGASFLNSIKEITAKGYWITVVVVQIVFILLSLKNTSVSYLVLTTKNKLTNRYQKISRIEFVTYSLIITFILLPLLYQAVVVPPNNYDSHHYHLHRILAWTYYGNLDHYPTEHLQQLYHNVFSEYLLLNVYLLNNSLDTYVNLVQYIAGLAGMVFIRALAKHIGLSREGQLIATTSFITLPVLIFEMTTTQVDLLASFYLLAFIYFGYKLITQFSSAYLLGMAVALILAGFTKYPTLFYALPFCIYFGIIYLKNLKLQKSAIILLTCCLSFLLIFTPFLLRNYRLFGHPLSPSSDSVFFAERIPTESYNLAYTFLNSIKNISLHLGLPHAGYNQNVASLVETMHTICQVDINQPETSIDSYQVRYSVHEDTVPNSLHLLLLFISVFLLFFYSISSRVKWFWFMSLCGFLLFCTMFKFQLWSTRTHMPFFAMGIICIGAVVQSAPRIVHLLTLGILLCSTPIYVLGNPSKPLFPLTFLGKKILAQIPVDVCPKSVQELNLYKDNLSDYYDFETATSCYPTKQTFDYTTRKEIQRRLIEIGFYAPINQSIGDMATHQAYFMNMKDRYNDFWPLTRHITAANPVIGFITTRSDGAYFYQASFKLSSQRHAQFVYIYTKKEFNKLPNYKLHIPYQYILTDNLSLSTKLIDPSLIKMIRNSSNGFALIELIEPSYQMYSY